MERIEMKWNECKQPQPVVTYIEHEARKAGIYLPSSAIHLCIKMIGLNVCVWHINDRRLLNQIVRANYGDRLQSDVFQVAKLNWKIELYPSGLSRRDKRYCVVFVRLLGMPSSWKSIFCQFHVECPQMQNKMVFVQLYNKPYVEGWRKPIGMYISSFGDVKASCVRAFILSFVTTIRIARITLKEDNKILFQMKMNEYKTKTQLQWKIDEEMLKKLKSFDRG
eukprot:473847_1